MTLSHTLISTAFGDWSVSDNGDAIIQLNYWPTATRVSSNSPLGLAAKNQIERYLRDPTFDFDLPLQPIGTDFQKRVWQAMLAIPVGSTQTYGEVVQQLNSAARAVGGACRVNPIPLIIPCHRIVAKQSLGGFSGQTQGSALNLKQQLLQHEGAR